MIDYNQIIDKYYESGSRLREILTHHSASVAQLAIEICERKHLPLDKQEVQAAAMLHDIGIVKTDAPGICCCGTEPYLKHGVLGAAILRSEGCPEWLARVAERHTGSGITGEDIRQQNLPLPMGDYLPETQLERLICYADKFYSKSGDMQKKDIQRVRRSIEKFGPASVARFEALHHEFQ